MSRPVTPAAAAPMSTSTPAASQSQSNLPQRPLSPVSPTHAPNQAPALSRSSSHHPLSTVPGVQNSTQAPVLSRSNSHRPLSTVSGVQNSTQAPVLSRSNSHRPVSTTSGVQGPSQAPALSRSNTQKSGYAGSRPLSFVGGDGTNDINNDKHSTLQREDTELSQGGFVNDETHIPINDASSGLQRTNSQASHAGTSVPSRGSTLKKKASLKKSSSLKRSGSKKSSYAGSVRSMRLGEKEKYEPNPEHNSAFYCPVPTSGSPTDLLADRFQAWRRVLKDLINYFRDLQKSYELKSKALATNANAINNTSTPPNFLSNGGLADASYILRTFHKMAFQEANKARDLENEVIVQLTGLRSDLQQKIKEIKSLSGDFKNSVGKEQDATKKVVRSFQESLGHVDHDAGSTTGKHDPFLVKLNVDRQIEKQIEEENYLHRAYLNLEASGRELESIVVGEIQKAYNVLANIMKREADHAYEAFEKLKEGPLAMGKDYEWDEFVVHSKQMVDPRIPLRHSENIMYTGKDHPAAIEVKSGMLERKSKYLKNYTPGWYVLSPTHLHEFKSADRIAFQSPVMSLYLPEQKLGTHSEPGSTSHKFMLKGRQAGGVHRGHSWIFRAETHDTMLAWYNDVKELTEKRGEARNEFVRRTHARTVSGGSIKAASIGSAESGIEEDEADKVPFSSEQSVRGNSVAGGVEDAGGAAYIMDDDRSDPGWRPPQRPTPGGRFPSDLNVERGLAAPLSPSSGDSYDETDREAIAAASALPGSNMPFATNSSTEPHTDLQRGYEQQNNVPSVYEQQNNVPSVYGQQNNVPSVYGQQNNVPSVYGQQNNVPSVYGQQNNVPSAYEQQNNVPSAHEQQNKVPSVYEQQNKVPSVYKQQSNVPSVYGQQSNLDSGYGEQANAQPASGSGYLNQANAPSAYAQQTYANQGNEIAGVAPNASIANSTAGIPPYTSDSQPAVAPGPVGAVPVENASNYGEWMAPMAAAAGVGGVAAGAGATHLHNKHHNQSQMPENADDQQQAIPAPGQSSAPITAATAAQANATNRPRGMTDSTQDTLTATSFAPTAHTTSTVPTSASVIGTEAPAPPQTLLAAGVDPNPTKGTAMPFDISGIYADAGRTGYQRPNLPPSARSVTTISDLHIPGEFPRTAAY